MIILILPSPLLVQSGAGASTAAATVISAENNEEIPGTECILGTECIPGTRHRTETAFLGARSKQEEKGVSPWKGFQTNEGEIHTGIALSK